MLIELIMKKIIFLFFILFSSHSYSQSCTTYVNGSHFSYPVNFNDADFQNMVRETTDAYVAKCASSSGRLSLVQTSPYPSYFCGISCGPCPVGTEPTSTPDFRNVPLFSCKAVSSSSSSSSPSCSAEQYYDTILKTCAEKQDNQSDCGEGSFTVQSPQGFSCFDDQPDNTNCSNNIFVGGVTLSNYSCSGASNSNTSSGSGTSSGSNTSSGSGTSSGSNTSSGSGTSSGSTTSSGSGSGGGSGGGSVGSPEFQNCELTFGVGNCQSTVSPCPNSYKINGQTFCAQTGGSGSGSSVGSGSGFGTSSGSNTSQGQCDPTAKNYDECMGRNKVPTKAESDAITNGFKDAAAKDTDDYLKSRTDDITSAKNDGISFATVPNAIKSLYTSLVPTASSCSDLNFTFIEITATIKCSWFDAIKLGLAWFFSVLCIIDIWRTAMRKPVS